MGREKREQQVSDPNLKVQDRTHMRQYQAFVARRRDRGAMNTGPSQGTVIGVTKEGLRLKVAQGHVVDTSLVFGLVPPLSHAKELRIALIPRLSREGEAKSREPHHEMWPRFAIRAFLKVPMSPDFLLQISRYTYANKR